MPVKPTYLVSSAIKHSIKKIISILLTMIAILEKKINLEKNYYDFIWSILLTRFSKLAQYKV